MIAAELRATGSRSTRRFHGLVLGKTVQRGAPGTRSACAEPPAQATATIATAAAATARTLTPALSARTCPCRTPGAGTRIPPPRGEPIEELRTHACWTVPKV